MEKSGPNQELTGPNQCFNKGEMQLKTSRLSWWPSCCRKRNPASCNRSHSKFQELPHGSLPFSPIGKAVSGNIFLNFDPYIFGRTRAWASKFAGKHMCEILKRSILTATGWCLGPEHCGPLRGIPCVLPEMLICQMPRTATPTSTKNHIWEPS